MYEIIIKQHTTKKVQKQERGVIDKRPYTDKELAEANSFYREDKESRLAIKEVMGWLPAVEKDETETRTVYTQEVEDLDLVAVINAVNARP